MPTLSLSLISYRTFITDAVVLLAVYFVPALSHVVPFPVHLFEPMRVLLVVGISTIWFAVGFAGRGSDPFLKHVLIGQRHV